VPCKGVPAAAADQDRCAQQFIVQFGRRAYRRPLTPDEIKALGDYYDQQRRQLAQDFPGGIRMLITAMLMSPKFLYHWELAPAAAIKDGAFVRYNPHEMASRLSYLLYASMPDEPLFAAADAAKLARPDEIEQQARRMLKDPRARDAVADFFIQWLGIAQLPDMIKDTTLFKDYGLPLVQAMIAESRDFVANLMVGGDGKLTTLLTSSSSYINPALAALYKVPAVSAAGPTALDGRQRAGILTQASFLAAHATAAESHPVRRGKMVADRLLCQDLPLPPDNVPDPKPAAPDLPTRQRYAEHGAAPCATACHSIIDPLGFAFENYDAVGGYRTTDGGQPVDATGVVQLGGQTRAFANAIELVGLLAQSDEVRGCMGAQWLRYALRRQEGPGDAASLASAQEAFRKSSYDIRELIVGLVRTHAFTHRTASMGEILP
jgi:hypothetical protein